MYISSSWKGCFWQCEQLWFLDPLSSFVFFAIWFWGITTSPKHHMKQSRPFVRHGMKNGGRHMMRCVWHQADFVDQFVTTLGHTSCFGFEKHGAKF